MAATTEITRGSPHGGHGAQRGACRGPATGPEGPEGPEGGGMDFTRLLSTKVRWFVDVCSISFPL